MPYCDLQHGILDPVVNGQRDVDGWNLDIPHDSGASDIQYGFIGCFLPLGECVPTAGLCQRLVVRLGLLQHFVILLPTQVFHFFRIIRNRL